MMLRNISPRGKLQCMSTYLRVKICGITNEADAIQAAELGADLIGLNFYKESPRFVTPEKAELIIRAIPRPRDIVGIFVSEYSPDAISFLRVFEHLPLDVIQVHGPDQTLPLHLFRAHKRAHKARSGHTRNLRAVGVRWIPAFSVSEQEDLLKINRFLKQCRRKDMEMPGSRPSELVAWMNKPRQKDKNPDFFPEAILVDAHVPGQFGGTGKMAPWELLAEFRPEVPVILAGGLTAENVAEAVRIVRPYAVDVASGVERSPGIKDPEKMKRFIENAREAFAGLQ
jgi:phosphoribosylanthranilate isomerase